MNGKIVLITGATSGFGKATALALARMGATVIIGCSSKAKGEKIIDEIKKETGSDNTDLFVADLSSQKQIKEAVNNFKKKYKKLHVLINNAGVYLPERHETEEKIESVFATNYLSHFLLTHLLLDLLKKSAPSRIINVASRHNGIRIKWDDIMQKKKYTPWQALGQTKLALVLFTKSLSRELKNSGVTVNSLHPAVAVTGLGVYRAKGLMGMVASVLKLFIRTSAEKGAETQIYLATSPEIEKISGQFFVNKKITPTSSNANNPEDAKRLWDLSMKLTNISKY